MFIFIFFFNFAKLTSELKELKTQHQTLEKQISETATELVNEKQAHVQLQEDYNAKVLISTNVSI